MAAPQNRVLTDSQIRDLRALRRAQPGSKGFTNDRTVAVAWPSDGLVHIATAVCGPEDTFDEDAGELLARQRLADGYFIVVDEDAAWLMFEQF